MDNKEPGNGPEEPVENYDEFGAYLLEHPEPDEPIVEQETGPESTAPPEPAAVPEEPVAAPEPEQHRVFAGTGISWAFIFGVILTAAIIVLAVQNTDEVPVKLFFWETEAPLIIVMLVTALAAVLIDELIGLIIRRRKRRVLAEREELKRLRARSGGNLPTIE